MKRLLVLVVLLASLCSVRAEVYKLYGYTFSYKYYDYENDIWTDWSEWTKTKVLIVVNVDKDRISIYSNERQEYDIYKYNGKEKDDDGGESIKYNCVNEDGLRCQIRLRKQVDGSIQLYVDFNDMIWVYGLKEY